MTGAHCGFLNGNSMHERNNTMIRKTVLIFSAVVFVLPFYAMGDTVAYIPKDGEPGHWEWSNTKNWFLNNLASTPISRVPTASDTVYLYSSPLAENPLRIPEGTAAECSDLWIGGPQNNTNTIPAASDYVMLEVCGGTITNHSKTWLGYIGNNNGPVSSAKVKISSGKWTSLHDFHVGGGRKFSWMDIEEDGEFEALEPDKAVRFGFACRGGAIVTNKGLFTASNLDLGWDYTWTLDGQGYTTGIVVNAGVMNITNDLKVGNGKYSYASFENRGTLNVGHHLYLGCTNKAVSVFNNYGTLNVYREFKLGTGVNAGMSIYRHLPGASLSKKVIANYRYYYVGLYSPAIFSIDGGTLDLANAKERIIVSVDRKDAKGRLEVIDGGTLKLPGQINLAYTSNTEATMYVGGEGSKVEGGGWIIAGLYYGDEYPKVKNGRGDIIVADTGTVDIASIYLGYGPSAVGTLTVTNGGRVALSNNLGIGYLDCTTHEVKGATTGIVTVAGSDSMITNVCKTYIGCAKSNNFGLLKMEGGKYFYIAEKDSGSQFYLGVNGDSSAGEIRGWGLIAHNKIHEEGVWPGRSVHMAHCGKAIADGEGIERDLDMGCMWSLGDGSVEPNRIGCNGWYARNKGRLRMPHLHEVYGTSNSRCVGDYAAYAGDPRLVNSFRFTLSGIKAQSKFVWADLYAPDRSDIPTGLASRTELGKALAIYRVGFFKEGHKLGEPVTPVGFDSGTMKFHYSPEESEEYPRVRVYHHDGTESGSWRLIGSTAVSAESPFVETTTFRSSAAHWNFGWFAVVSDRPRGTVLSVR